MKENIDIPYYLIFLYITVEACFVTNYMVNFGAGTMGC
jgi:hypothetical protein